MRGGGGHRYRLLPVSRPFPTPRRLAGAMIAMIVAGGLASCGEPGEPSASQLGAKGSEPNAAAALGFPAIATRNTTRVGGGDATADAAGVASAAFPATTSSNRPAAVVLVDKDDWQGAIAASVLAASPIGAPILLTEGEDLPAASAETLDRLDPGGADLLDAAEVIRIGEKPPKPDGRKAISIVGRDPYQLAANIDRVASDARGTPSQNVVVASGEVDQFAMPAAAWAARSGDGLLLTTRATLPAPTRAAIARRDKPNIFVLGPLGVIGPRVEEQLARLGNVRRIEGATAIDNAIAFARYRAAGFGWGITVPGQNFAVASVSRPLDAAAAAPLAAGSLFAPLLLTDSDEPLPASLIQYLRSLQPGYERSPNEAVFNHVWILGDERVVSVAAQARIDEVTELVPIGAPTP